MLKSTLLASAALLLAMGTAHAGNFVSISQSGGSNEAFVSQSSSDGVNESIVKQFSTGSNSLKVDQDGKKNIAKSVQKGKVNDLVVKQDGKENVTKAVQDGKKNTGNVVMKDDGKVVKKTVWVKENGKVVRKIVWVRPPAVIEKPTKEDVKKVPYKPEVEKPKPTDTKVVPVKDVKKPDVKKPEVKKPIPVKVEIKKPTKSDIKPTKPTEVEKVKATPKEKAKPESTNKVTTNQSGGGTASVKIAQSGANNEANAKQDAATRIGNIVQTDATGKTQSKAWNTSAPGTTTASLVTPPKK